MVSQIAMRTALLSLLVAASACSAMPSPMARAQETAQEFNMNVRYGRTEIAVEHVAPAARDQFSRHHRGWGSEVRIADLELEGFHSKDGRNADVTVRVGWFRPDEGDLHSTTLKQSWHEDNGWKLTSEERIDGDAGLLGEAVVYQAPDTPKTTPQFPTVRLQGTEPQ